MCSASSLSDRGLHDQLDASSSPTRHQQKSKQEIHANSHSEGKLGVQVNRCAFSTLNRDKAIKEKRSPPDDRK